MDNRNTPHELDEMFPNAKEAIHALKLKNAHFARLTDDYHRLNREIHRMETNVEPTSDEVMETERKKRLKLLDEISSMLQQAK